MSTLDEIAARDDHAQRRLGMIEDTFGAAPHYTSDGRDGHDDYECADRDRRYLLGLVREAREALTIAAPLSGDDPRITEAIARLTEGSDRT